MHYTREDACRAWLTHALLPPAPVLAILNHFGSAVDAYEAYLKTDGTAFDPFIRLKDRKLLLDKHSTKDEMHSMMLAMRDTHMGLLSQDDALYPDALRDIPDPPAFLFYRGDPSCLMHPCITIVGTRKPSFQAPLATKKIACELSQNGVTIVSGMAYGIDGAAHEGCLEGGSPTAAVMSCGLDVDYPADHRTLKQRLLDAGGVLLSEYPPGVTTRDWFFQARNRILSGLSRAVVMMECSQRSGSMLTVRHALEQGKEVYAYPGNVEDPKAAGAAALLREGANFFTCAENILSDLGWEQGIAKPPSAVKPVEKLPDLTEDEKTLFSHLGQGEQSFDELSASLSMDPAALSVALTMLQLKGLIRSLPGKIYRRASS